MPTPPAPASPPPLRIQPATEQDIPTIITLAEATWEPTYRFIISKEQIDYMYRVIYTPASLRRQMREQHHQFLLAYVAGQPSGFASFSEKPEACITSIKSTSYPRTRARAWASSWCRPCAQAVREADGKALELNVNRHNPALAFYERQGFVQHREEDIPIGPYWMNDYVLRKEL